MAYSITTPCVDLKDQSCVEVCPVDCIHYEDGKDRVLFIDPDECIDCGACEPVCPVEAIFENDAVPDDQKVWIEINALWFNDKDSARAKVAEVMGG
jgi:NAD-dependent dihydropyrimidine dehydrogenase PreA subunit